MNKAIVAILCVGLLGINVDLMAHDDASPKEVAVSNYSDVEEEISQAYQELLAAWFPFMGKTTIEMVSKQYAGVMAGMLKSRFKNARKASKHLARDLAYAAKYEFSLRNDILLKVITPSMISGVLYGFGKMSGSTALKITGVSSGFFLAGQLDKHTEYSIREWIYQPTAILLVLYAAGIQSGQATAMQVGMLSGADVTGRIDKYLGTNFTRSFYPLSILGWFYWSAFEKLDGKLWQIILGGDLFGPPSENYATDLAQYHKDMSALNWRFGPNVFFLLFGPVAEQIDYYTDSKYVSQVTDFAKEGWFTYVALNYLPVVSRTIPGLSLTWSAMISAGVTSYRYGLFGWVGSMWNSLGDGDDAHEDL